MKKTFYLLLIAAVQLFVGCKGNGEKSNQGNIKVVVTILPYAGLVKSIAGDNADITVMIPPQSACETYEPTPVDIAKAAKSSIYFSVGANYAFERNLLKGISENYPGIKMIDCSGGVEIKENNPHIWLYPAGIKKIMENISNALVSYRPDMKDFFEQNKNKFLNKLDSVDAAVKLNFAGKAKKKFLVFHPSWYYFAENYNIEQIAVEKEGKEPTARDLKEIVDLAKKYKIGVVFAELGTNETMAASIKEELKADLQLLNPMEEDILKNLLTAAQKISGSMK